MSVVVLLGCWTAGKTSTVKRLQSKYEGRFVFIDSDAAVSQNFGGFLGNIFLAHADDPKRAHEYIDWRERYLLTKLLHVQQPCLLAAGPLLVTREPHWSIFVNQVRPVCFHVELSAGEIYRGLKKRRAWQQKAGLDLSPGFGSWDEGLLTKFDPVANEWTLMSESESIASIENELARLVPIYERYATRARTFRSSDLRVDGRVQINFDEFVAHHLKLDDRSGSHDFSSQNFAPDDFDLNPRIMPSSPDEGGSSLMTLLGDQLQAMVSSAVRDTQSSPQETFAVEHILPTMAPTV